MRESSLPRLENRYRDLECVQLRDLTKEKIEEWIAMENSPYIQRLLVEAVSYRRASIEQDLRLLLRVHPRFIKLVASMVVISWESHKCDTGNKTLELTELLVDTDVLGLMDELTLLDSELSEINDGSFQSEDPSNKLLKINNKIDSLALDISKIIHTKFDELMKW